MSTRQGVIDAITGAYVYTQFPNAVGQELVVSKIAKLDAVDSAIDRNSGFDVTQLALAVEINVFATRGKVVADFVHRAIFVYRRIDCKWFVVSPMRLQDLEVDVDVEVYRYRFAGQGGGFEAVLADGFQCFLVETHAYAFYDADMGGVAVRVDLEIDADHS